MSRKIVLQIFLLLVIVACCITSGYGIALYGPFIKDIKDSSYDIGYQDGNIDGLEFTLQNIESFIPKEIVTVTETVYSEVEYDPFDTIAEFTEWWESNKLDSNVPFKIIDGGIQFCIWGTGDWDCDDFAEQAHILAIQQGRPLSLCLVYQGKVMRTRVMNSNNPHMGNLVMIGNDIYFVEPQGRVFRLIKICERD